MIVSAVLMLVAAQAAPVDPAPPPPVVPTARAAALAPPADWSRLPPMPWREAPVLTPDLTEFVAGEVREGRCPVDRNEIAVEVAVMMRRDGTVRAAVPRAIDCPTVEQFAAGLVTSFARGNLRRAAGGWYLASLTFDWAR
ncbi:hypothetical protein [Sphingomonas sp.]|uniref:hypothetical protein n=1 Tax=Sphingomonas sp. TaxID=28214 RepID=UPI002DD64AB9|nr:hypothetical protein [Sphingomonas sp.]